MFSRTGQFLTAVSALLFLIFQSALSYGQLSGVKTIPGDYLTVQAAVVDLNSQGVGLGGVTFNVAAGHIETLSGRIILTATGTVTDPIIFQKSGVGANPVLNAYVGIDPTPSVLADGFWVFAGSDYVTIDGIDLMESASNTTTTTVMEFGFGLFKASDVDGCQFNTIKNCTITLDKLQNTTWTAPGHNGSIGIAVLNGLYTATGVVTVISASGSNSYNQFHSNTIQNCNAGISFVGFAATSPFDLGDTNNDVGGSSALTGNTILNFGGGAAANPATGIFASQQWGFNVSYNTINNNNGSGANHTTTMRGIFLNSSSTSASANCNFNTITLTGGATTSDLTFIENAFGSTAASNTININNNALTGSYPTATSGAFRGIYNNGATPAILNVQNNVISNLSYSNIGNTGTGVLYPIHISGSSAATTINATGNAISNISRIGTTGGTTIGLYVASSVTGLTVFANNNTIQNMSIDGTGTASTLYGIQTSTGTIACNGNTVDGLTCIKTTGTSALYGIYNISSPVNEIYDGNIVRNLTHNGTGTTYGIYAFTTTGTRTVSNNLVHTIVTTGTTVAGMNMASSSPSVFRNKIYNISSTSAGAPTVSGILQGSLGTAGTSSIYNNYVGDITAPNATTSAATSPSVRGINVTTTTANSAVNISFNTVYLNTSSTGTNFGSAGLFVTTSTVATTANLTLSNNIIVNQSTPSGIGNTTAYQRSSTSLANYNDNSNRNLFFKGTPSPQNLIYFDGTNAEQLLSNFKAFVTPKEAQSIAENPPFLSTAGSNANFLHINPTIGTQIESGAANIAGITDDFDGDIRQGNAGYTGAGSAPDIGADEGDFTFADLSGPTINYTLIDNTICLSNPTLDATITDPSSVNTTPGSKPRVWFKKSTENNVLPATNTSADNGWKWVEATNSSSPFNFVLDYSLLNSAATNGDVIEYFVVAEDLSGTPNVGGNLATFSNSASSVQLAANVFPVSNTNSYSLIALPASVSADASISALCFSGNTVLTLNPTNLGAEYQWESSPAGLSTWSAIPGATMTSFSATGVSSSTDYRCIISCASVPVAPISPTAVTTVVVNDPQVVTTTPGSACNSSTVSVQLEATGNSGSNLNWYATAAGGTAIGTGATFNTPAISTSTTYYVAASVGGSSGSVGPVNPTIGTTSASTIAVGTQRMFFDVVSDATIVSVDIFPTAAIGSTGSITIRDNTQTVVTNVPYTTTVTGGAMQTITLNAFLPAGTAYEMGQGTAITLNRNTTGAVYPYTSSAINITGNSFDPNYYYFFYNWQFSTGCESARVPVLATVTNNATGTDVLSQCGSYTWIDGMNYTSSNNTATYIYVGGAANGCDSIVTLDLTIINPSTSTDIITECGSYTWIDGNTYTSSNSTATFNIVGGAANGCDSIVTLDLTINNTSTSTDIITECGSYTWIDGNTYTSSNNTATFNIVGGAANGCDSIVTLNLTITTVNAGVTDNSPVLTANQTGATYQWVDCNNGNAAISGATNQTFTATTNGNYAVVVTQNGCSETSACVSVTNVGLNELQEELLLIYPNPSTGVFFIAYEGSLSEVRVLDMLGRPVPADVHLNAGKIDASTLTPGNYLVQITTVDHKTFLKHISIQ